MEGKWVPPGASSGWRLELLESSAFRAALLVLALVVALGTMLGTATEMSAEGLDLPEPTQTASSVTEPAGRTAENSSSNDAPAAGAVTSLKESTSASNAAGAEPIADDRGPPAALVTEPVSRVGETASRTIQPAPETITPIIEPIVETVSSAAQSVIETVSPMAQPVIETIEPLVQPVVETIRPVIQPVIATVSQTAQPVVEILSPIVEPVAAVEPAIEAPAAIQSSDVEHGFTEINDIDVALGDAPTNTIVLDEAAPTAPERGQSALPIAETLVIAPSLSASILTLVTTMSSDYVDATIQQLTQRPPAADSTLTPGSSSSPRVDRLNTLFASLPQWATLVALGWLVLFGSRLTSPRAWQSQLFTPPR